MTVARDRYFHDTSALPADSLANQDPRLVKIARIIIAQAAKDLRETATLHKRQTIYGMRYERRRLAAFSAIDDADLLPLRDVFLAYAAGVQKSGAHEGTLAFISYALIDATIDVLLWRTYDCSACGACCIGPITQLTPKDARLIPSSMTRSVMGLPDFDELDRALDSRCMKRDRSGKCAAFRGTAGVEASCAVADHKPESCISMNAGNLGCLDYRKALSLAPSHGRRDDWQSVEAKLSEYMTVPSRLMTDDEIKLPSIDAVA